ncbi:MAG TPA: molybdopterin-dependent oxidoreductase [Lapillicoccus sp.]|nr:molybdopterin-dependent oxidoreductase [Lapillicoccus sp.]
MTGRWANLALAVLVPLSLLSGVALFLVGSGPVWLVAVLHGGLGLAFLALVPWKRVVVRRGLAKRRPGRDVSILLTWVLLFTVLSGVAHLVGLTAAALPVTVMQLHVTAGVVATVLTIAHAVQRPVRVRRTDWGRRALLRGGAVTAAAAGLGVAAAATGSAVDRAGNRQATGSFRVPSDQVPVTQWFLDSVPEVDLGSWRLTVVTPSGARQLGLAELSADDEVRAILDCTGGWWADVVWRGMRLSRLAPVGATVLVTSTTGYARRLPVSDDVLLATTMGGQPLTPGHGAPVRLVVPGRRGYHWVKWVERVEVVDGPWWAQPPLPLR